MGSDNNTKGFRFPAEFEKQEAIWLGWPVYENKKGVSSVPVFLEIIRVLVSTVKVKIAAQDIEHKKEIEEILINNAIPMDQVSIYPIPHNDIWFRDMGPVFLSDNQGKMLVQKFAFNGWGRDPLNSPLNALDQIVPFRVAQELQLPLNSTTLISEGGDREFNGKGTMITVEAVELQRNPGLSRQQIEDEFIRIFNLKNVIWLKKGVYEDDHAFDGPLPGPDGLKDIMTCVTTGGHIDEFCRFVSTDTVLVAEVSKEEADANPIAKVNRERMEENTAILRKAVDQDGKPLKIVRIPLPDPLFSTMKAGDGVYDYFVDKYKSGFTFPIGNEIKVIAACSYNNFLITNGAILAPQYWKPGLQERIKEKDQKAVEILGELFPDRKVYTFDVMALNLGGGGIHCITQQQPFVETVCVV
ncbi:MAG: agmatine deiminase family protein [Candidatus Aminicenantes bacterium]|jgi:agmatine deiminase